MNILLFLFGCAITILLILLLNGYTIPTKISASWLDGNEYWAFFRSTLKQAKFN